MAIHYNIIMCDDVVRDAHCEITMAIHYNIIMCNDVVRDAHCEITMGGEHIHYFCVRLFHLSFGLM